MNSNNIEHDFHYVPLVAKTKRPLEADWQNRGVKRDALASFGSVPADINVGVLTGAASDGLVDIDLDGPMTIEAGARILPSTGLVTGRCSRPASHWFYRVEGDTGTIRLTHPVSRGMIVELRGNGCQTMMAGSEHPDGELVRFEDGKDSQPSWVSREDLLKAVRQIATVSVLSGLWTPGGRHTLTLWFAGLCACNEVSQEVACPHLVAQV
ncbi:bifunctional DNA primase/polymerase [Methylobacterium brachiatum]|uniref:bifunctional DNA primase/polymerase n=1 Tax=Methylobacterium brachiatum TaxID=269660 RepID=UPI000EFC4D81|nr:bifunctional DNA primase/polymerase [Methylobacterium brachiatum]AYO81304.1 hypothetical protein EBB05_02735 [Methylobacterium brachiatum]